MKKKKLKSVVGTAKTAGNVTQEDTQRYVKKSEKTTA